MDPQIEPEAVPEYMRDRMAPRQTPRQTLRPFLIFALLILSAGFVIGAVRYANIIQINQAARVELESIARERERFTNAFTDVGIDKTTIVNGFWYTYTDAEGNEHVLYFDPDALARAGISDDELRQLAEVVGKSRVTQRNLMRTVSDVELPEELQFHNAIYAFGSTGLTTLDMKNVLLEKMRAGRASSEELFELSYLYELEGNYAKRDRLNQENCTRFRVRCENASEITATGRVVDTNGLPIAGATVEIVSRAGVQPVLSNKDGIYSIPTGAMQMEKLRVRASKRNYSDGYADAILLATGVKTVSIGDIALESPITIVSIDFDDRTVTGSGNRFTEAGVVITTSNSIYEIPEGAIVDADGKPYDGPIDIYLYEFTKGNPPESLMQIDTFDDVMGFAGDLMKTFGMPYIQFFTQDGVELHVRESAPMMLTYRIADMEALRANQDQIYEPLTDADMQFLVEASRGGGYPIDREFLINNNLLRFPAFWVFDRKRGVWDNIGVSVLDTQGTIKTIFYTLRDD